MRRDPSLGATLALAAAALVAGCRGSMGGTLHGTPTKAFPTAWDGTRSKASKDAEAHAAKAAADDEIFAALQASPSVDAYIAFLGANPESPHRNAALTGLVELVGDMEEPARGRAYDAIVVTLPDAIAVLPPERALLYVGPLGMQVKDVIEMRGKGLAVDIIASKIAGSESPYRDFTLAELGVLKDLGVPDPVVKAMLDSHTSAIKARKEQEEKDSLRKELASLRALVEAQKGSSGGGAAPSGGPVVQTKEGPLDAAACIAKRFAALKLCEQIPWPGSTVCQSTAESSFPCK